MPTVARPSIARTVLVPLHWIERARGRWRLALLVLYALIGIVVGSLIWRAVSLTHLPDIGDPFDVDAYRASLNVPDDRKAIVLYQKANERCTLPSQEAWSADLNVLRKDWSRASPALLAWMDDNREALALWRQGTERPAASGWGMAQNYFILVHLARLQGMRLEAQGDLAGAWGWYRALLRASRHMGMHIYDTRFNYGPHMLWEATPEIEHWAADPRVDATLLRRALAEMIAIDAMTAPPSDLLKWQYLDEMRELDEYESAGGGQFLGAEYKLWYFHLPLVLRARYFFLREPERSRRLIRLLYANRLAFADAPPSLQPPEVAPPGVFDLSGHREVPARVRALTPEQLAGWLDSTLFARRTSQGWRHSGLNLNDLRERANLILTLARELYRREHGQYPPDDQALVGPYLKALPDIGLDPVSPTPAAP